ADRPVDIFPTQDAPGGSDAAFGACLARRRTARDHSPDLDGAFSSVWAAQSLAAEGAREPARGAVSSPALDARDGSERCGARARLGDDHAARGRSAARS